MANNVGPDQIATSGAACFGSALFAQAYCFPIVRRSMVLILVDH